MPTCILCLENRDLTREHIVPESLGGCWQERLLCKGCNDHIGAKIEGPFANSLLVQLPRISLEIHGKTGDCGNPTNYFNSFIRR